MAHKAVSYRLCVTEWLYLGRLKKEDNKSGNFLGTSSGKFGGKSLIWLLGLLCNQLFLLVKPRMGNAIHKNLKHFLKSLKTTENHYFSLKRPPFINKLMRTDDSVFLDPETKEISAIRGLSTP